MAKDKKKELTINNIIDLSVKKINKINKISSDSYISALHLYKPKEGASDKEITMGMAKVLAQYKTDLEVGKSGKGKPTESHINEALGEIVLTADRYGITIEKLVDMVRAGDYQIMDSIKNQHLSEKVRYVQAGHYYEHIHHDQEKWQKPIAKALGADVKLIKRNMKGTYEILHEDMKSKSYLRPKKKAA